MASSSFIHVIKKRWSGMKRFPLLVSLVFLTLLVMAGVLAETVTAASGTLTLASLSPSSGATNTTGIVIDIVGTNFAASAGFRLVGSSSEKITGYVSSVNSTHIVGTVNLDNQEPGDYEVCVYNNATSSVCGLTFTVTAPVESSKSSVFFDTYPTGATVLLDGTTIGTSVFTYRNATPGTFTVLIRKSGYEDYTGSVTVPEGTRARFYAALKPLAAGTTATPVITATTIRKSTLKVPTTWPGTTPTETSPGDPALVIGAAGIGLGVVVFRRR
jgi:hypothetical protein